MSVSGKVIAITGGAQGIGAATARALSSAGAKVAVGDLDATLSLRRVHGPTVGSGSNSM